MRKMLAFALILAMTPLVMCRPARSQAYNVFEPGGALQGSWNSQSVNFANSSYILSNLPVANLPSISDNTILGRYAGSTGTTQQLNPLAVANMLSAVIAVDTIATSNLTLTGAATVDGQVMSNGQFVLAQNQTTGSQNGIYVVNTAGAWARAANFPSGYIINQNCEILIRIRKGTTYGGTTWYIATSGGSITIGTTAFNVTAVNNNATSTRYGVVELGGIAGSAISLTGSTPAANDCVSWQTSAAIAADLGDANGNKGDCALTNSASGHLILNNNGNPGPTASVGTINANSTDHWGAVTGLSGATTLTITFSVAWPNSIVGCTANDSTGTAIGETQTVSGGTVTAVTFTMAALTGSLYYTCFGLD